MKNIDWPKQLVSDLAAQRAVVVIGSGASKQAANKDGARPPLWGEFLSAGVKKVGKKGTKHIRSAIRNRDYLHACEWLKKALDEEWPKFLREQFVTPKFHATEIHDLIFRLDSRITISPNFDDIYERRANEITKGNVVVKNYYEDDVTNFLRDEQQYVVKMHGSIASPDKMIFSRRDYGQARINHSAFYQALDACLLTHTFVFLGCGIEDPDIALLLENQNFTFPTSRPHYFITPKTISKDMEMSLRDNRNLKCLKYDPRDGHLLLVNAIKDLKERVEALRLADGASVAA